MFQLSSSSTFSISAALFSSHFDIGLLLKSMVSYFLFFGMRLRDTFLTVSVLKLIWSLWSSILCILVVFLMGSLSDFFSLLLPVLDPLELFCVEFFLSFGGVIGVLLSFTSLTNRAFCILFFCSTASLNCEVTPLRSVVNF